MSRAINVLLIFLLSMTLFGGLLASTGVAATLGLSTELGSANQAEDVVTQANESVPTGSGGVGDTLFGLYNILGGTIGSLLSFFNPGLAMLSNAGVPSYLMEEFLIPIVTVIKFLGIAYFIRGV